MKIEILILPQGIIEPTEFWLFETDRDGNGVIQDQLNARRTTPSDAWQQVAITINSVAWDRSHRKTEVFLVLIGDLLENMSNESLLEDVIQGARECSWGANIYVCFEQPRDFVRLYPDYRGIVQRWFAMVARAGIAGIIEIKEKLDAKLEDRCRVLRNCAVEAQNRRREFQRTANQHNCRALIGEPLVEDLIERLISDGVIQGDGRNEIVFYADKEVRDLSELRDWAGEVAEGELRLLTSVEGTSGKDLHRLWGLKPVYFNGVYEWIHAFIQINQPQPTLQSRRANPCNLTLIKTTGTQLRKLATDDRLRLLVTSAFDSVKQQEFCIAAAEQIGVVLQRCPYHVDVEVYPAMTCDRFPEVLNANLFTAWLHITHGNRSDGLLEGRREQYVPVERWEACFDAYRGNLQLIILSACESTEIARALAAKGVGVAIGYQNEVIFGAATMVAERVLTAALRMGDRHNAIIDAFQNVCEELSSYTDRQDGRIRRFSDAMPQAFAVDRKTS